MVTKPDWAPSYVEFEDKMWAFDCIGGTGEPIYYREEKGARRHVILVGATGPR